MTVKAMSEYKVDLSKIREAIPTLKAGDKVLLSGSVYTARDAAHKKMAALISKEEELPINIKDACIYFAGPTPTPEGRVTGSFGPTTSGRMDPYSPMLLDLGLAAMVGKGKRSKEVTEAIVRNKAIYFCAIGGAGALCSMHITSLEEIAFPFLGCESIKKLTFENFPVYVGIDCEGNSIYD